MRILQLIDSLEPGGAERMAVNYANSLAKEIEFSGLVATRKEGNLKNQIDSSVNYLFLNKKRAIDFKAVFNLKNFVKQNDIKIIHAHGTSFFLAFLLKLVRPSVKIVWHDHFGNRSNQRINDNKTLWFCSHFFASIIAVNKDVESWNKKNLNTKKVVYIPNFTVKSNEIPATYLKENDGKRIVCLSNLHQPKNHLTLLKAFLNSNLLNQGWSLHLIGKDYNDTYSDQLKKYILDNKATEAIFLYGSCSDVYHILRQSSIGVLASYYEGFPITLLEYGLSKLPVISTNVGYCSQIIKHNHSGFLFDPNNTEDLELQLKKLCDSKTFRESFSENLNQFVENNFSEEAVIKKAIKHYQSLL